MATPQTIKNEATAARALLRSLAAQADLEGVAHCVHPNLPPTECVRCAARRELAQLADLMVSWPDLRELVEG